MKYQLLKEILLELEIYETSHEKISMDGFRNYLNDKKELKEIELRDDTLQRMNDQSFGIENQITYLITMMRKYAKHYAKDGFKDLPIHGLDDFGFLALGILSALNESFNLSKSANISLNCLSILFFSPLE